MSELPLFAASSLADGMARVRAETKADKVFLTWPPDRGQTAAMTREAAGRRIDAWTRQFQTWGLKAGDRVLVSSRDDGGVVAAVLACLTWGVSAVILDPTGTAAETGPLVLLAKPAAAIVDASLRDAWGLASLPFTADPIQAIGTAGKSSWASKLLRRSAEPEAPAAPTPAAPRDLSDSGEAYVLFTSGSTSRPKGVCISRGSLFAHVRTLVRQLEHNADSRVLNPLLLHHVDGLVQGPILAWLAGATCLRPMRFEVSTVENFCAAVYRERATHLVAVPTILTILLEHFEGLEDTFQAKDFRAVISTAGYFDERTWKRFEDVFHQRVGNVYGLTESVTGGCFAGPADATRVLGTVGRPVDCEVQIMDESGKPVAPGTPGEVWMRGPNIMMGYLNDATATSAALRDGWLRTGDLGTVDSRGFVRIVGRLKSVVITGGQNIQPEEVNDVLRAVPGVRDAATFGIPDPTFGEILVGCVEGTGLTEGDLIDACRRSLSGYKIPRALAFVSELPRGPSGKVTIAAARKLFLDSRRPAGSAANASTGGDVAARILGLASEVFKTPAGRLSPSSGPADTPGWDSFGHLGFVSALEDSFRVRFSTRDIMSIRSLTDAERLVRSKGGN